MRRFALLAFLVTCCVAFTNYQEQKIRELSVKYAAPRFTAFAAAPLNGDFGFTEPDRAHVVIDGARLECCPHTFANVVHHELDHAKGRDHNKIPGDIMSYAVTIDQTGAAIEDAFVWA